MKIFNQNDYRRDPSRGLKVIGGMNTVIHCHHYNSRLQRTIEGNTKIDGKGIIRESAAIVYHEMLQNLKREKKTGNNIQLAQDLYSFIGFGTLAFEEIEKGIVTSSNSHYVEGWGCGAVKSQDKVCRVTEGYIEAFYKAILNKDVSVEEVQCLNQGCGEGSCHFKIEELNSPKYEFKIKRFSDFSFKENKLEKEVKSNIDKAAIVDAVINLPLEGNNEGLIPAFNVYLAHTPQDFYNMISIRFIKEMGKLGLAEIAQEMLVEDAENCALNTFGGILDSEEWAALIAPMLKQEEDTIFGLIAVANALGWGRFNITEHTPYKTMGLESSNGYEAYGYIEFEKYGHEPQCFMLKGVASGLMALVYEKGDLESRVNKYECEEPCCLAKKDPVCRFSVSLKK